MPDTDIQTGSVTKPAARKRTTSKPRVAKFVPYKAGQGDKEMLSPESQVAWMDFWGTLTEKEKATVGRALNTIIAEPIFHDGYRKFFRFWRIAVRDLLSNIKF